MIFQLAYSSSQSQAGASPSGSGCWQGPTCSHRHGTDTPSHLTCTSLGCRRNPGAPGIQPSWGACADATQQVAPHRSKIIFSGQCCNRMKCSKMLFEGLQFVGKSYIVADVRPVVRTLRRQRNAVSAVVLPRQLFLLG